MTDCVLRRFFPIKSIWGSTVVKLLEGPHASAAYEKQLVQGTSSEPRDRTLAHSGLFTFCANVSACCGAVFRQLLTTASPHHRVVRFAAGR